MPDTNRTLALWGRIKSALAGSDRSRHAREIHKLAGETKELKRHRAAAEKELKRLDRDLRKYKGRVEVMETQLALLIQATQNSLHADEEPEPQEGTPQERYWAGHNGVRYVMHHLAMDWDIRVPVWREILAATDGVKSVIELGCNIGDNLRAIDSIAPGTALAGVEINRFAAEKAQASLDHAEIFTGSLLHFETNKRFDLAFTRGVLIHVNPDELGRAYSQLARLSAHYVLIYEHYSPEPYTLKDYAKSETIVGTEDGQSYQFWRDFATDFQAAEPGWKVVAEGPAGVAKEHGALLWALLERA